MTTAICTLDRAARLVRTWGSATLPNGLTLCEQLTIGGLSLWDVSAPSMAAFSVPHALLGEEAHRPWWQRLRGDLGRFKEKARDRVRRLSWNAAGCAAWPAEPTAVFLAFSAYMYRDVLAPVIGELDAAGVRTAVVHDEALYQPSAGSDTLDPSRSVWRHWDDGVTSAARRLERELQSRLAELRAMHALPSIIRDGDEPLWRRMASAFSWLQHRAYPRLIAHAAVTAHILERHRPAVIVSSDGTDPRARIYYLLGRRLGIPSLEVQFGLCGEDSCEWQFSSADQVAVWGEAARDVLLAHGVPSGEIVVTGSPRHDLMSRPMSLASAAAVRARYGVPTGHKMVLFASLYSLGSYSQFGDFAGVLLDVKRAVFETAAAQAGLTLVVKPHPLEDVAATRALAGEAANVVFANPADDIREMIPACDAFVTLGSTATTDALVANKPVIFPAFPGLVFWDDNYLKSHTVEVALSRAELQQTFARVARGAAGAALHDLAAARDAFLVKWAYRADGQSAARASSLVLQMMGRSAPAGAI